MKIYSDLEQMRKELPPVPFPAFQIVVEGEGVNVHSIPTRWLVLAHKATVNGTVVKDRTP
jgi:hypothetical protein